MQRAGYEPDWPTPRANWEKPSTLHRPQLESPLSCGTLLLMSVVVCPGSPCNCFLTVRSRRSLRRRRRPTDEGTGLGHAIQLGFYVFQVMGHGLVRLPCRCS